MFEHEIKHATLFMLSCNVDKYKGLFITNLTGYGLSTIAFVLQISLVLHNISIFHTFLAFNTRYLALVSFATYSTVYM